MNEARLSLPTGGSEEGRMQIRDVEYAHAFGKLTDCLRRMPESIAALKEADNRGCQCLLDDLIAFISGNPEIRAYVRQVEKDGVPALAVGDPNWLNFLSPNLALVAAFGAGYAIGSLVYETGCARATGFAAPDAPADAGREADPGASG